VPTIGHGFRRTLVGLKSSRGCRVRCLQQFQTHPCGVEVGGRARGRAGRPRFRRTLVGLK